jgi:hypothetical protein
MYKFKTGDKVKCVGLTPEARAWGLKLGLKLGQIYEIKVCTDVCAFVLVPGLKPFGFVTGSVEDFELANTIPLTKWRDRK